MRITKDPNTTWVQGKGLVPRSEPAPVDNRPLLTRLGENGTFQTLWVIWSSLWAVVWVTVGWYLFPLNLLMLAVSLGSAFAFSRQTRPDPAAWAQPPSNSLPNSTERGTL